MLPMKSNAANSEIECPSCRRHLPVEDGMAYCPDCDLHLTRISSWGKRIAGYALSLPERISRIAVGSLAGLVKGVSDLLLPEAVRHAKIYQVLLKKNLRYLIQEVGDVKNVYAQSTEVPSHYVARKFVGNFMELTGILTLHASPVWILALISDISGGAKTFLREFAESLKEEGLLDPQTDVDTVDQLLKGLQSVSGKIADQVDTPPLSAQELRQTLQYLREEAQAFKLQSTLKHEDVDSMFEEMKDVARKEQRSLYEISAAMAMSAMNELERSGRRAVTGLRVGQALLDRTILKYYARALKDLSRLGYYRHVARSSKPYLRAIRRHLAWRNITWTERYFLSRLSSSTESE
jgi:hypothetical protein